MCRILVNCLRGLSLPAKELVAQLDLRQTSDQEVAGSTSAAGVVGWCEGAMYLTSPGRPTDIGLQLGKACYPCSG